MTVKVEMAKGGFDGSIETLRSRAADLQQAAQGTGRLHGRASTWWSRAACRRAKARPRELSTRGDSPSRLLRSHAARTRRVLRII